MPTFALFRLRHGIAPVVAALCLAGPAQAQVTYGFESRFGVTYERDGETGESRPRPGASAVLTMRLNHQFDNGLRFQVAIGVDAGNLRQRGQHLHQRRPGR